jgi:GT2 family glycosyltransferase
MRISVIIPVWNGASVIAKCLEALFENSEADRFEVVCVDNSSSDGSASLIADIYPQVRLLQQPINLGFAGGVNVGIEAAEGDIFILLNQDCIVQPGWMVPLLQVLESSPNVIIGGVLLNQEGMIDHAGAIIQRPEAIGVHLTEIKDINPWPVEYVSGAVFAFRRNVWETVGRFDEGFYPAYYEDADYCLRARRYGIEVLCVPQVRVVHLRSSEEWRMNPLRHRANYYTVRYRFACKHFNGQELNQFFESEKARLNDNSPIEETLGRIIGARRTLFSLPEIVMRRKLDLGEEVSSALVRQIQVGLGMVLQEALALLEPVSFQPLQDLVISFQELQSLQEREYLLIQRIYFRSPLDRNPEPWLRRLFRLLVLRPLSFLIGRDYLLLAELNTLHTARMDRMAQVLDQMGQVLDQMAQAVNRTNHYIKLLETLVRYEGL